MHKERGVRGDPSNLQRFLRSPKQMVPTRSISSIVKESELSRLNLSQAWIGQLMDMAGYGVWAMDPQGNTTYLNEAMARILGYTVAAMRGEPLSRFLYEPPIPEATEAPEPSRCRLRHKNGSTIWAFAFAQQGGSASSA